MRLFIALAGVAAVACGCGEYDDCKLGELTGTWHVTYKHTNGNCGNVADETVSMEGGSKTPPKCTVHYSTISPDKCTLSRDSTCPTTDNKGTQRWTYVLHHVDEGRIEGTGTVQVKHQVIGVCRSTYNFVWKRL